MTDLPYRVLRPYTKWHIVAAPFGLTVPFSVAACAVVFVAAVVMVVG